MALCLNALDVKLYVGKASLRRIQFEKLVQGFVDWLTVLVQLGSIGVKLLLCILLLANLLLSAGRDHAFGQLKSSAELFDNRLLVCLVAVQLKTEILEACVLKLVEYYIQSRLLLRNKQDRFTIVKALGNDVGDRLALSRSGNAGKIDGRRPV